MKLAVFAVAVFFAVLTARASIEVNLLDSDALIVYTAESAGESDVAQFTFGVSIYAVDADVYFPIDVQQLLTLDWGSAGPFVGVSSATVTSTGDSYDGFFLIQEGSNEHFWMSIFATASEDTIAQLQITGLNWTDKVGGDLVTLVQAPPLETDQLFINTEIVPEPGAIVLIALGGGILSIIAMRRRRSAQKC